MENRLIEGFLISLLFLSYFVLWKNKKRELLKIGGDDPEVIYNDSRPTQKYFAHAPKEYQIKLNMIFSRQPEHSQLQPRRHIGSEIENYSSLGRKGKPFHLISFFPNTCIRVIHLLSSSRVSRNVLLIVKGLGTLP